MRTEPQTLHPPQYYCLVDVLLVKRYFSYFITKVGLYLQGKGINELDNKEIKQCFRILLRYSQL